MSLGSETGSSLLWLHPSNSVTYLGWLPRRLANQGVYSARSLQRQPIVCLDGLIVIPPRCGSSKSTKHTNADTHTLVCNSKLWPALGGRACACACNNKTNKKKKLRKIVWVWVDMYHLTQSLIYQRFSWSDTVIVLLVGGSSVVDLCHTLVVILGNSSWKSAWLLSFCCCWFCLKSAHSKS